MALVTDYHSYIVPSGYEDQFRAVLFIGAVMVTEVDHLSGLRSITVTHLILLRRRETWLGPDWYENNQTMVYTTYMFQPRWLPCPYTHFFIKIARIESSQYMEDHFFILRSVSGALCDVCIGITVINPVPPIFIAVQWFLYMLCNSLWSTFVWILSFIKHIFFNIFTENRYFLKIWISGNLMVTENVISI